MTFSIFNFGFFAKNSSAKTNIINNIYDFEFVGFNGSKVKLSEFKNKVLLIVNTASKCGFTSQYGDLEKLHQKYKDLGLIVIGVPSNDFGGQEPLNNNEIQNFCKYNYGVNFLVTQKEVVSGKNAHPFYLFAKEKLG
ncbi:MAG: glutathione peroxidase, partial [Alphaproteobacteria bacterium]